MKNRLGAFVFLLLLSSCNSSSDSQLGYKVKQLDFRREACQPETDRCLMISIDYPEFDEGDSAARAMANRLVGNYIMENLGMGDVESLAEPNIAKAVADIDSIFEDLKAKFILAGTGWEAHVSTNQLFESDSILVLAMSTMTYFGGAHPNRNLRLMNFDRNTGKLLPLELLVPNIEVFKDNAEKEFRRLFITKPLVSYSESGFGFPDGRFALPANFALIGDSILLHYNHYEIASYAAGEFEITVPRNPNL